MPNQTETLYTILLLPQQNPPVLPANTAGKEHASKSRGSWTSKYLESS